tara:strand:- start:86 stop:319 length:234 start_codon:yes stop_codon:yes gene_type:complete
MKRLLLAPLLLTLVVGCSTKDKTLIERRDDCAETFALNTPEVKKEFLKKYKLENYLKKAVGFRTIDSAISNFCKFYL